MEVTIFADLKDVATSHDVDLRKHVMAAAGKYPEGKMTDFSQYKLSPSETIQFESKNELILIIQSEGKLKIKSDKEIITNSHDLVTIHQNMNVTLTNTENEPSLFYCLHWNLE